VEDKLACNKQNLEANAVRVSSGLDNRWTVLHPARFLAGAACSTKKLWISARETIEVNGHCPVANYDMNSIGLGGFVTSKGWIELANPGSTKLSLKLFNINNVGKGSGSKTSGDLLGELEDISELGELKLALRTLRAAAQFVCPWNFSFLAIENFLIQNDFCMSELGGTDSPAATLAQFIDYVLHENANRWRDSEGFINTGELKAYWVAFSSARPKMMLKKRESAGISQPSATIKSGQKGKTGSSPFSKLPFSHPRINLPFTDACRAWNAGKCRKPAGTCTTAKGIPLKHVCNYSDLSVANASVCGQAHQSCNYH
jgi:hypothetical protein